MINKKKLYGQFYTELSDELLNNYKTVLTNNNKILLDPFVGQGHLLDYYLNLFSYKKQKEILLNKKIYGYDIDPVNINYLIKKYNTKYGINKQFLKEIFQVRNTLLNPVLDKNYFILTNPPYLAKNVFKKDFKNTKYFNEMKTIITKYKDFFELAIDIYSIFEGIWIVPSNYFVSKNFKKSLLKIFNDISMIYIYNKTMFKDTQVGIATFYINKNSNNNNNILKLNINNNIIKINKNLNITELEKYFNCKNKLGIKKGLLRTEIEKNKGNNKLLIINENYQPEHIYVNDNLYKKLTNNILISRNVDTGSNNGKLGLYTANELWNISASSLITKNSSRTYIPIFFPEYIDINIQLKIKQYFNNIINELRDKYDDIFLTNFKNITNYQRKRITFKEMTSLINYIYYEIIKK